jgi:MYXO-CTERM domain-containing protein
MKLQPSHHSKENSMSFKTTITALAALVWLSVPGMAQTTAPEQPATTEPTTTEPATPPTTTEQTTTDTAVQATQDDDTDFGWIGLLGLLGLAGLIRRPEPVITTRTGSTVESDTTRTGTGRL